MKEVEVAVAVEEAKRVVERLLETEIPKTLHLKSKWSLIATQLALLQSNLVRLDPTLSPDLDLDLLGFDSIADTLSLTLSLSHSFQSPSLPHGKLLSQSLLHSALSSLRLHVSDSLLLLDRGLLSPPPSSSAPPNRDAVPTLVARLQIGCPNSRTSALDSLLRLLNEQDENVIAAISQGIIPVLLALLDSSPSDEMKDKTVAAISRISTVESGKHALDAEGLPLLNHLLRVVEAGSGFAQLEACNALRALTFSKENARAIAARGGIASLMEICVTGMSSTQASAVGVLGNLALFPEVKDKFVDEGAVSVLFGVLSCGTAAAREDSIRCLCNLVREDDVLMVEVVQGRVIPRLKNYWDSVPSDESLQVAVEFLSELASCHPIGEAILADGFLEKLLGVLRCSEVSGVRIAAALAIHKLSHCMKSSDKGIGDGGCIPALVGMLDGKSTAEREAAAMALSSLVVYTGNRRIFCGDTDGVTRTVRLLDPSVEKLDKRYPVSILASLVNNKKWRKVMVTAGACGYLEKLARMEVEGARKLYDSILGRGKIWGILPHQGQS